MKLLLLLCVIFPYEVSLNEFFPIRNYILPGNTTFQPRIYGGVIVTNNKSRTQPNFNSFGYMIFLKNLVTGERCCGSLVRRQWVLTAGHCVNGEAHTIVFAGGSADMTPVAYNKQNLKDFGIERIPGKKIYRHPYYHRSTLANDLALVKLASPFKQTNITVVQISFDMIWRRRTCTLVGWGVAPNPPQYVLRTVKNKRISTVFLGCRYKSWGYFICLARDRTGVCVGDSGSPIICDGKVAGVASHLYSATDCGYSLEEFYVEISPYRRWVNSVLSTGCNVKRVNAWIVTTFLIITSCLASYRQG